MASPNKSTQPKAPNPQLGYPILEKLIETEDFSIVNKSFTSCYDTLEKMLKAKSGGLKKQKAIREALKAYDLTVDLIRELLKTKYQIIKQKSAEKAGAQKK